MQNADPLLPVNSSIAGLSGGANILALSPHPDDIALSCGGLMQSIRPGGLTLMTCFSRSNYAPFARIAEPSADDVRLIRTSEDKIYASRLKARYVDLGLDDVSLRITDEDDWTCEKPVADDVYESLVEKIAGAIGAEYTHILCPLSIGHNVDHIIAREAAERGAGKNQTIVYYEDLPYGERIGGPQKVSGHTLVSALYGKDVVVDITPVMAAKIADVRAYESQMYPEDIEGVVSYAAKLNGRNGFSERFWFAGP